MRFALAVLVSALAQLLIYVRLSSAVGGGSVLAIAYIVLAALGAGWFAARRGALAGALSVVLGAALYGLTTTLGPAGIGMSIGDRALAIASLVVAFWPYAIIAAIAGALGALLRASVLRPARRR